MKDAALEKGQKLNIMMITIHYLISSTINNLFQLLLLLRHPKCFILSTKAKYERQISVLNGIVKVISATVNNEFILNSTFSITVTLFSITDLYIYIYLYNSLWIGVGGCYLRNQFFVSYISKSFDLMLKCQECFFVNGK